MANKKQILFFALCSPFNLIACRTDARCAILFQHRISGTNTTLRSLFRIRHVDNGCSTFDLLRSSAFLNYSACKDDPSC